MEKKLLFILVFLAGLITFSCKRTAAAASEIHQCQDRGFHEKGQHLVRPCPEPEIVIQAEPGRITTDFFFNDTLAFSTRYTIPIPLSSSSFQYGPDRATRPNVPNVIKLVNGSRNESTIRSR